VNYFMGLPKLPFASILLRLQRNKQWKLRGSEHLAAERQALGAGEPWDSCREAFANGLEP